MKSDDTLKRPRTWRRRGDHLKQARREQAAESEGRVREAMARVVEAATGPDEGHRQAVLQHVRQNWPPFVRRMFVERLAEMLGRGTESGRQAAASLIQLGACTLPVLTGEFTKARSVAVQQHTLEVLAGIGRRLGTAERGELMMELVILMGSAVEEAVRRQVAEVVAALRRASESPSSRGRSPRPASGPGVPEAPRAFA